MSFQNTVQISRMLMIFPSIHFRRPSEAMPVTVRSFHTPFEVMVTNSDISRSQWTFLGRAPASKDTLRGNFLENETQVSQSLPKTQEVRLPFRNCHAPRLPTRSLAQFKVVPEESVEGEIISPQAQVSDNIWPNSYSLPLSLFGKICTPTFLPAAFERHLWRYFINEEDVIDRNGFWEWTSRCCTRIYGSEMAENLALLADTNGIHAAGRGETILYSISNRSSRKMWSIRDDGIQHTVINSLSSVLNENKER